MPASTSPEVPLPLRAGSAANPVLQVLNLEVDAQSYWLYTNTPLDNARLRDAALHQAPRMLWSH